MIRGLLFSLLTIFLTIICFVPGINGLFPIIDEFHNFLVGSSTTYADVFPWMQMDSTGLLLFISLAKTMASFVLFADVFGLVTDCLNSFVTLYLFAIFSGAAYFNHVSKIQDNFVVSVVLIVTLLFRQLLRVPKCSKC